MVVVGRGKVGAVVRVMGAVYGYLVLVLEVLLLLRMAATAAATAAVAARRQW